VLLAQEIHIATGNQRDEPLIYQARVGEPADLDLCFKLCF
jgi:hypothetical protein